MSDYVFTWPERIIFSVFLVTLGAFVALWAAAGPIQEARFELSLYRQARHQGELMGADYTCEPHLADTVDGRVAYGTSCWRRFDAEPSARADPTWANIVWGSIRPLPSAGIARQR